MRTFEFENVLFIII